MFTYMGSCVRRICRVFVIPLLWGPNHSVPWLEKYVFRSVVEIHIFRSCFCLCHGTWYLCYLICMYVSSAHVYMSNCLYVYTSTVNCCCVHVCVGYSCINVPTLTYIVAQSCCLTVSLWLFICRVCVRRMCRVFVLALLYSYSPFWGPPWSVPWLGTYGFSSVGLDRYIQILCLVVHLTRYL